ncbi:hypothetical protein BDV93DRAFT_508298 [Ceratobasidium sp. AG-I]|nr:hypothetical protein BDV93DRAFT_508298 [Ceratobasidium sp. AG-I]
MPTTAHPTANRYIAITGLALVRESTISDPKQSKLFTTRCDFNFRQDGPLTLGVLHFSATGAPEPGSVAFVSGELWFPTGDEDELVDASAFNIVASVEGANHVVIPCASVCAVGYVEAAVDRDWTISVAVYDRISQRRTNRSFMLGVNVPETGRFRHLKQPVKGSMVSVRGVCLGINTSEVAEIELEAVTFIYLSGGSPSSSQASSSSPTAIRSAGRSKRELLLERQETPMKKVKIGPASTFPGSVQKSAIGKTPPEFPPSMSTGMSSTSTEVACAADTKVEAKIYAASIAANQV